MDKNNVVSAEIVRQITRMVVEELQKQQRLERSTPIGVSNRHVHLDRRTWTPWVWSGSELTVKKMLGQPGQYASEETVTIRGPKGELSRVRVLGPLRAQTQVEISIADGFTLGSSPRCASPVRLKVPRALRLGPLWECKEGQRRDRGAAACAHDSEGRGALRRGGRPVYPNGDRRPAGRDPLAMCWCASLTSTRWKCTLMWKRPMLWASKTATGPFSLTIEPGRRQGRGGPGADAGQ